MNEYYLKNEDTQIIAGHLPVVWRAHLAHRNCDIMHMYLTWRLGFLFFVKSLAPHASMSLAWCAFQASRKFVALYVHATACICMFPKSRSFDFHITIEHRLKNSDMYLRRGTSGCHVYPWIKIELQYWNFLLLKFYYEYLEHFIFYYLLLFLSQVWKIEIDQC